MRLSTATIASLVFLALPAAAAAGPFESTTRLSGAQEVPAVPSDGTALAQVQFDDGFSEVRVRVRFRNLDGEATRLHFHCNVAGANGPIALGLVAPGPLSFSGSGVAGTLTNADLPADDACLDVIGFPVNNLASLAAAIDRGLVYLNLHTDVWPGGELRGQVRPLEDEDEDSDSDSDSG